ncbi:hypothetical protein PIB30_013859 [Stylosanthes scabra]|uniref:Ubiquitin-like protease family profile domain-containing protein n=1 Tax=Stylosanthes scabra TaxID=79078 RepID=A0ABU6U5A5_9FABA|nr:hypothetical protein [Stylosanthes scabra]
MAIPKTEEANLPTEEEKPSQAVVEEVIDLTSSPEDDHQQQPFVVKQEQDVDTSPGSQLITSTLMSFRDQVPLEAPSFDLGVEEPLLTTQTMQAIDEIDEQLRQNPGLLQSPEPSGTFDILADIEKRVAIWETIPKGDNEFLPIFNLKGHKCLEALRYQFKSTAPTKHIDIQVVSIIVSIICHILNRTPGERYQNLIYCVPPELLQRMFEKYEHKWLDDKKKPQDFRTLLNHKEFLSYLDKDRLQSHRFLFAPTLFARHWWLYVVDVGKKHLFVLDSKNVVSPSPEKTQIGRFGSNILDQLLRWLGKPSMFKKGQNSLLPMYINIPQQPNEYDCAVFVMKWMEELDPTILKECHDETRRHNTQPWIVAELEKFREKIVSNILLSPENTMRLDVITEVNEIRLSRPAAPLRSPFTQLDSADLKTK